MKNLGAAKITKGVVKSRLELLERNWNTFSETHDQLLDAFAATEKDSPYFKKDYMGAGEEAYVQQKAILLDQLKEKLAENSAGKTESSHGTSTLRSLPKITLPSFSGDYNSWSNFRDLFQSLIIDNDALSLVEKLHYLKISLSGEPAQLLQNIPMTGDNFERAWNSITQRYQNLRVLITSQLASITALPPMKRESSRDLKELLHGTTDAVQALEAMKRPVQHWDDWLVFITAEKLDSKTRMGWETAIGSTLDPPTLAQLTTFLTSKLRALEAVEGASGSSATTTNPIEAQKQGKRTSVNSTLRLKAHATHTAGEGSRKCLICQKDHFILFCPTFKGMNPRERKQLVTEKRLCYNCLVPHSSQACKSTKRCQVCVGKHHTSLHSTFEQSSAARSSLSKQVPDSSRETIDDPQQEPSASIFEKVTHCAMTSCSVTSAVSVILATAELMLVSDQGRRVVVRALIDPCSEVSLMEESVAQILNLKRVLDKIPVIGVGKTQTYTKVFHARIGSG
nr:uncharacterized protein LOC117611027 [Osmia lignaria]